MKNWEDIQDEIRKAEEPLSPHAWKDMESKLGKRGRRGWLAGLIMISILLASWGIFQKSGDAKEYYNARHAAVGEIEEEDVKKATLNLTTNTVANSSSKEEGSRRISSSSESEEIKESEQPSDNAADSFPKADIAVNEIFRDSGKQKPKTPSPTTVLALSAKEFLLPNAELSFLTGKIRDFEADSLPKFQNRQRPSRWELRFFMAGTYNIPSLEYHTEESQTHKQFAEAVENAVQPGWGVDAGFEMRYRLFRNLRISTGFSYREIVTRNHYDFEVNEVPVIDSASGNILAYIPVSEGIQRQEISSNMYSFLNIPLSLYYEQPLAPRWTLTGEAINNISFLINQSGYGIDPTTLEIDTSGDEVFNNIINSYQLRLGLRYELQENFYLALEPSYRKYYQDFFKSESISWKPQDVSLSLSAIVKFD